MSQKFINNIEEIVKNKLKELQLKPIKSLSLFIKKKKRFYSTPCLKKNKKFFFKILISKEVGPQEAIQREIGIREFLSHFKNEIKTTKLIESDNKNFPYWYLSEYKEGKILGHFYEIWSKKEKFILEILKILFSLQKIPINELKEFAKNKPLFLWQRNLEKYSKMIKEYQLGIEKRITKNIDFKKIYHFLNETKKIFPNTELVFSHGDFTLANFVVCQNKLIIVDWEQVHLDNFAYDLSHLWIQLWRYPHWRIKILKEFMSHLSKNKIEEFKLLFRSIILSEALGELKWSINRCQKKYKNKAIKSFLKTIQAALINFDNLLKIK